MTVFDLVERERTRLQRAHVAVGVALTVAAIGVTLAGGAWLLADSRWLALPRAVPMLVWGVGLVLASVVIAYVRFRYPQRATRTGVAAVIEREQQLRAGELRGVLEVADAGPLGRRAAERLAARLKPLDGKLAPAEHRRATRGATHAGITATTAIALLVLSAPSAPDGLAAVLHPVDAWRGSLAGPLTFRGLPTHVVRGERLVVRVAAPGRVRVHVALRLTGEAWRTETIPVNRESGIAQLTLPAMRADVALVAGDGRTSTDTVLVRAADRPFLAGVTVSASYPAYLGRPAESLPAEEVLRVPRGTVLSLAGRASTELSAVRLTTGRDTVSLAADGHGFAGRLTADRSGSWRWMAAGASGAIDELPSALQLDVVPDSAPSAEIVEPRRDTIVALDDRIPLRLAAADDHGLALLTIETQRVPAHGEPLPVVSQRIASAQAAAWSTDTLVSLLGRGLEPGDALRIRFVATDNSPWAQRTASRELLLRLPSDEERRIAARAAADSTASEAVSAARAQRALTQRTEEAARDRGQREASSETPGTPRAAANPPSANAMSFEAAERARAVAQEQRTLAQRVEQLRQSAAALQRQLQQAGALDSSLARQLEAAQALLRDALTPELRAQMQRLETAAQQLEGDQARAALRDLALMQQQLREQLERSAEMLKRAALEGAMQTLRDEARDIAQRDRALADSVASRETSRAAEARSLAERSQRFADDTRRLQERLQQEHAEQGASRATEAQQHGQASAERMRAAAQSAQGSSSQGENAANRASDQAREAGQQMAQAAQAMQDARDRQVDAWKQELTAELDRAIQEALSMGREESAMEQQLRSGASAADVRGQQNALQSGVQTTAQRLQEQSRRTALLSGRSQRAMQEAQQRVAQATDAVADQRGANAASAMRDAGESLNRAAASLARDRERANSATSASGFSEMLQQMQDLARRQNGINSQSQGLFPMNGGQPSPGAQATARALARQQRQIAQQLDELGEDAGGERAAQLAREARQVADALDGSRIDASTLARQEQLFRRLLDAGRSLEKEERDDPNRRESRSATGDNRYTPTNQDANGRAAERFREPTWEELRGLSADERRVILEYFKRINAQSP